MASPFLDGNYAPVDDERVTVGLPIEGRVPDGLRGTLFRNGPNPQLPPAEPYHWFTGDGMVHAITLGEGTATYRNRWIRTARFEAEARAGRALFAGFGQPLTEAARSLDNGVANTHILDHGGRLLALEEAHLPVRLDPGDLATLGTEDFGGLTGRFTAHPKTDPATGQLVFFSYSATGPLTPGMSWGTIEADGRLSRREIFDAPYCSMVHDFAVTARHVVFPVLPLTGDLRRAMSGRPAFAWEPSRGAFLGVMRRDEGVPGLRWQPCETCFVFHVMNAHDAGGEIVIDVVEYDEAPLFPRADGSPPADPVRARLCRWHVDPSGAAPLRREILHDEAGEFPRIDERRSGLSYRYGFRICPRPDAPGDEIVRHDLQARTVTRYIPPDGQRPSEAVFVPASAGSPEGVGWLLTIVHRPAGNDSALLILDAASIEHGPIAAVVLPRRIPFGFHGSWQDRSTLVSN